jgi:nucleoside-diphosphate-sugar epimerase
MTASDAPIAAPAAEHDPAGKCVLVTGATGFIGGAVARRLLAEGASVRALARSPDRALGLARAGVDVVVGDVTDAAALRRAVAGCEWVFHFAGVVNDARPLAYYQQLNVAATGALAEAALDSGCTRFVHASSIRVYGLDAGPGTSERSPYRTSSDPYSDTKRLGEALVRRLAAERGLPAVIVQPSMAYGPEDQTWTLGPLQRIRKGQMVLPDGGRARMHMIFIDDLVDGILAAARRGRASEAYILAGPEVVTWREYCGCLARIAGRKMPPSVPGAALLLVAALSEGLARLTRRRPFATRAEVRSVMVTATYDGRKAREELGFVPRVGLAEGMKRTEAWLQSSGLL